MGIILKQIDQLGTLSLDDMYVLYETVSSYDNSAFAHYILAKRRKDAKAVTAWKAAYEATDKTLDTINTAIIKALEVKLSQR